MPTPQRKSAKRPVDSKAPPERQEETIRWPQLEPLVPRDSLYIHEPLHGQIFTISNFWTQNLCRKYVSFLSGLPLVTTPGKPKKGEAVRVNDRFQVEDPGFARLLWERTGLKDLMMNGAAVDDSSETVEQPAELDQQVRQLWGGDVLGMNPNIRIYRYRPGQFFDKHYDESNSLRFPSQSSSIPAKTTWTLLLYLTSPSSGCHGGETVFYPEPPSKRKGVQAPEPFVASLETGMALLHRHGKDCMLHEGREVTAGEKWVIRSDICVRR